jgi:argininosuccinate lyase
LGVKLADLPLADWQAIHPAFGQDVYLAFDVDRAVAKRSAFGGTAFVAVAEQIQLAREKLEK